MSDNEYPVVTDDPEMLEALQYHARLVERENEHGEKESYFLIDFDPRNAIYLRKQRAWQCPACGCGVRGDVEVCPNCVKKSDKVSGDNDKLDFLRPSGVGGQFISPRTIKESKD